MTSGQRSRRLLCFGQFKWTTLNRPIFKAEYYSTRILKLATELQVAEFEAFSLFSDKSSDRMNDIDFISELLAFLELALPTKRKG